MLKRTWAKWEKIKIKRKKGIKSILINFFIFLIKKKKHM